MAQTWNNILGYIKRNLGAKLNLIEMSDDEIIEGLKDDVMPFISQYVSHKKACLITTDNITLPKLNAQYTYQLPISENIELTGIYDVYIHSTVNSAFDPFYGTKYEGNLYGNIVPYGRGSVDIEGGGLIDVVINNEYLSMLESISVKNTWEFVMPNYLTFDSQIDRAIVVYLCNHTDPSTIMPDMYHKLFKPYCLKETIKWLIALRSKYEQLATQAGEIRINWQKLESDHDKLNQQIDEVIRYIPLDHFIHIV